MKIASFLWRALRAVLLGITWLVILVEEWGWRPLAAFVARLARWPPLAGLEALIAKAPPRLALVLFLVPAVLLVPVKLLALWFIDAGHLAYGVGIIVAAKLFGTALVGRLFVLLEPKLLQFAWFARALGWWRTMRERVLAALRSSRLWRSARVMRRAWRQWRRRLAH